MTALVWSSLLSTVCTASSQELVEEERLLRMVMFFICIPGEDSDHIYCGQIWILQMVMKTTEEMPEAGGAIAGERDAIDDINGVEGERSDDWSF